MTKLLTYCFDKWWRPILYFGLTLGLVVASEFIKNNTFGTISFMLFGLGLIGLIISTIYQLIKRRWLKGILTGLLFGGTIAAFIFYAVFLFFIETVDGDKWADNLKIPQNIQLDTPIDLTMGSERQDSVLTWTKSKTDFQLYNSFQPGLYEFDFLSPTWSPDLAGWSLVLAVLTSLGFVMSWLNNIFSKRRPHAVAGIR